MKTGKKLIYALLLFTFMMFTGSTGNVQAESTSGVEIYNKDGLTITATSFDNPYVEMTFVNNGTRGVMVQAQSLSVNGFMLEHVMSVDVPAGKTVNDNLMILMGETEEKYITTISKIEFTLDISDLDTWETIDITEPITLTISGTADYVQEYDVSGEVLYDEDGIQIVSNGLQDGWTGPELVLFARNNSENSIGISAYCANVNEHLRSAIFDIEELPPGKCALKEMMLTDPIDMPEAKKIKKVEFSLQFYNPYTNYSLGETDIFRLTFK